ncbi:MAG: porin family protein, partial [Bryobacteraceae bacterium]
FATAALSQPVSIGVKIGAPLSDAFNIATGSTTYTDNTHRYVVGPSLELRLPVHFSVEADALYKSFEYQSISNIGDTIFHSSTSSGSWEFPILLKYRILPDLPLIRPYLEAGPSFSRLSGVKNLFSCTGSLCGGAASGSTTPSELNHNSNYGLTFGAGIDFHVILLHIAPEVRYTRWGFENFSSVGGLLSSNQNQAEFLVGISF